MRIQSLHLGILCYSQNVLGVFWNFSAVAYLLEVVRSTTPKITGSYRWHILLLLLLEVHLQRLQTIQTALSIRLIALQNRLKHLDHLELILIRHLSILLSTIRCHGGAGRCIDRGHSHVFWDVLSDVEQ